MSDQLPKSELNSINNDQLLISCIKFEQLLILDSIVRTVKTKRLGLFNHLTVDLNK